MWIVEPGGTGSLHPIDVERYDLARVVVAPGAEPGDVVVTAGVQALRSAEKIGARRRIINVSIFPSGRSATARSLSFDDHNHRCRDTYFLRLGRAED